MPHLVMEYSNSAEERLNMQGLLEDLHQVAIDSELFSTKDVKSRRSEERRVGKEC